MVTGKSRARQLNVVPPAGAVGAPKARRKKKKKKTKRGAESDSDSDSDKEEAEAPPEPAARCKACGVAHTYLPRGKRGLTVAQGNALVAFFDRLGGDTEWRANKGWGRASKLSDWHGVTVCERDKAFRRIPRGREDRRRSTQRGCQEEEKK